MAKRRKPGLLADAVVKTGQDKSGTMFDTDKLTDALVGEGEKMATKAVPENNKLFAQTAEQSAAILQTHLRTIGRAIEDLKGDKQVLLKELRGLRSEVYKEVAGTVGDLEKLRAFYLGETHAKELARMQEFVAVCERLAEFKRSGLLQEVAAIMSPDKDG